MPNNEVEMSFPKPPRKFSGEYLDPMLVIEDFDETVGMARRFARDNPEFTEEDLINRLASNGVKLYGTRKEWNRFFTDVRKRITTEATKKKPPEEVTWIVQHVGGVATYTMVEVVPTGPKPVEATAVIPEPEPTVRDAEPRRGAAAVAPADVMRALLTAATNGMMRPNDFADAIARRLRLDAAATAGAIEEALAAKVIRKVGSRGSTYITVSSNEPELGRRVARPETEEPDERLLTEGELMMVVSILDELAKGHITTGVTTKNLESILHSTFSRDHFRRLLRILESQRLIRFDNQANYKQARKSPRVHLRGQDTKNRWLANRDGYINRLKQAKIRLKGEA
jgi:hypothetical protein